MPLGQQVYFCYFFILVVSFGPLCLETIQVQCPPSSLIKIGDVKHYLHESTLLYKEKLMQILIQLAQCIWRINTILQTHFILIMLEKATLYNFSLLKTEVKDTDSVWGLLHSTFQLIVSPREALHCVQVGKLDCKQPFFDTLEIQVTQEERKNQFQMAFRLEVSLCHF